MTNTVKFKIEKRREVDEIVETITIDCEATGDQAVNVLSECVEALADRPHTIAGMPLPTWLALDLSAENADLEAAEPEGEA
jgi:hypothetical protein